MSPNDILHRIRTALRLSPEEMSRIFALEDLVRTPEAIEAITARPGTSKARPCTYEELGTFLDGLIRHKRGAVTNPPPPDAEIVLDNNLILKKLRIALQLKDPEIVILFALADRTISIAQIKDLFRNPAHPRYRPCSDAILNDFLIGLDEFYYDGSGG